MPPPPEPQLLLDAYGGAVAAYSFRKLRGGYAGSAVRIRRSSDNAESDIGFSGNAFDTAAAAAFIGAGTGFLAKWYDQSGNGCDITQGTAANQATYAASSLNGLPTANFTLASGCAMQTAADVVSLGSGTSSTVMTVGTLATGAADGGILVIYDGSVDTGPPHGGTGSAAMIRRDGANVGFHFMHGFVGYSAQTISFDTAYRMGAIFTGSNVRTYLNGTAGSNDALSFTYDSTGTIDVGGLTVFSGNWTGLLSEVVLWSADQTSNISAIDSDVATHWGF